MTYYSTHIDNAPEPNMQTTSYAVMHKETRQFFAGFDANNQPTWTDREAAAQRYADKSAAHGQALLFTCFGIKAQKKPVVL